MSPRCGSPSATRTRPGVRLARHVHLRRGALARVHNPYRSPDRTAQHQPGLRCAARPLRHPPHCAPRHPPYLWSRSWPRSTFTRVSRWPSSGTAGSRSRWRSTGPGLGDQGRAAAAERLARPLRRPGPGGRFMNGRCGHRCCISLLYALCERPVPRSEPAAGLGALGGVQPQDIGMGSLKT